MGGIIGLALIVGLTWWLLRSRRRKQEAQAALAGPENIAESREFQSELSATERPELHGNGRMKPELNGPGRPRYELEERALIHEMEPSRPVAELPGR